MTDIKLTAAQRRAVETMEGPVFVAAGAGSGKTGVVTRRFVHAIATGYAGMDQILTLTFTKKAAAEMMERIRELFHRRETIAGPDEQQDERMAAAYSEIELAQISTIDSFCASVLRANALAAGIDPNFSAVDDSQAELIREEVFDECLRELTERYKSRAVQFITAYDPDLKGGLFEIVAKAYGTLRSQGKPVTLPYPDMPDIKSAEKELRQVTRAARIAVGQITNPNRNQNSGLNKLARLEAALQQINPAERVDQAEMEEIKPGSMGPAKEEFSRLEGPRKAFVNAIRSEMAVETLDLFRELLESFDIRYSRKKHGLGVIDFADLALKTRNLLRSNDDIRQRLSSRFRLVMVDEFQDTNPLQYEIISMIANNNLFLVGDENQAIYGFRDAEVALFQKEKQKAGAGGYLIELKDNFRSQPEIIGFVDHVFNRPGMLAPGYLELEASAEPERQKKDFRVEILFVDGRRQCEAEGLERAPTDITRKAEAQLIAEHLRKLCAVGYEYGDVAVLLRTSNDAEIYRDALTKAGIETHFSVGTGYFSKLELHDVVNMFKLIINPLDDLAMLGVLRSPMVGLSDNALYWLCRPGRDENRYEPVWPALNSPDRLKRVDESDRKKIDGFVSRLEEFREAAGRETLRDLAGRVISSDDYAAKIAAGPNGKQNFANLLKLLDLAGDFEAAWSNDLADFTDFLQRQKETGAREVEAPTEAEGVRAVRVMTMHSAKGLEFPLVVLPNLQARGQNQGNVIMLERGGQNRVGLKYRTNGRGGGNAFDYDELREEAAARDAMESKRLGYVAMTRARKHLILSGVAAADQLPGEKISDPPFDWLQRIFNLKWQRDENLGKADRIEDISGLTLGLQICINPEDAAEKFMQAEAKQPDLAQPEIDPEIIRVPAAAIYLPPVISPTALDTYRACPRRYYLDNVLRVGGLFDLKGAKTTGHDGALTSTHMGLVIHRLLEEDLPVLESGPLTPELLGVRASQFISANALTKADHERAVRLIENFRRAPVADRLFRAAEAGVLRREVSFSTLIGQTILQGQIDAMYPANFDGSESNSADVTVVVDYKTGSSEAKAESEEELRRYRLQMASYAVAAGRMKPGPVRVVLVYLGGDEPVEYIREFSPEELVSLNGELLSVIDSMKDGAFPALESFDAYYCTWCSGGPNQATACPTGAGLTKGEKSGSA